MRGRGWVRIVGSGEILTAPTHILDIFSKIIFTISARKSSSTASGPSSVSNLLSR